jgi:hypothetical protein
MCKQLWVLKNVREMEVVCNRKMDGVLEELNDAYSKITLIISLPHIIHILSFLYKHTMHPTSYFKPDQSTRRRDPDPSWCQWQKKTVRNKCLGFNRYGMIDQISFSNP